MKNKGFTLIELLVVVLIIGILAAIALPMYTKTVEKARLAEALSFVSSLHKSMQRYILENGYPEKPLYGKAVVDLLDIDLPPGEWKGSGSNSRYYYSKYFYIEATLYTSDGRGLGDAVIARDSSPYREGYGGEIKYALHFSLENENKSCWTDDNYAFICESLKSQGFRRYTW